MPKYFDFKVYGYYLYFTSHGIIEAMHVHASDGQLSEQGSAKFFVRSDGDTVVVNRGRLTQRDIRRIQVFIKENYLHMYSKWSQRSAEGFYEQ